MIIDAEADGLLDEVTRIHVLAYKKPNEDVKYTHDYDEMREILTSAELLIGHNIVCYDIPMFEKILGIKISAQAIDTLALSWYLNHTRNIHGLDSYGHQYGIPKPKIDNWQNLSKEEYRHRCVEDVKINTALWKDLKQKLMLLYGDKEEADRLVKYLTFKMDCLREQEKSKWLLDKELAQKSYEELLEQQDKKLPELISVMPKVKKFVEKTKPAKPFKKDGSWSVNGAKWFNLLSKRGLPEDYNGSVKIMAAEEEANPNSPQQVKDWLFSLGWVPEAFDFKKNDDGSERKIPQIRVDSDEGKVLCPSVAKLIEKNPSVGVLEGLTIIQHRLSIFKGFLENHENGWLTAGAAGFTNTLRLKHRVLVNLPGVDKPWGKEIRGCLVAPKGYVLCGSDMSSLEDNTKKHYMYSYDPEYVKEMSTKGFDAHLDLAKHAKAISSEDVDLFAEIKQSLKDPEYILSDNLSGLYTNITAIRKNFKVANYSCIYGVGAPKLARTLNIPVQQAQSLIDAYWARNWAVKKLAEDTTVKHIGKEMWLYNPVSRFWYSLRYKKDIFSTLNQGTGVYCFDRWIMAFRAKRPQLTGQFHDEVILCIKEGAENKCRKLLLDAIKEVNDELKLNVELGVDIQFGKRYSNIH